METWKYRFIFTLIVFQTFKDQY